MSSTCFYTKGIDFIVANTCDKRRIEFHAVFGPRTYALRVGVMFCIIRLGRNDDRTEMSFRSKHNVRQAIYHPVISRDGIGDFKMAKHALKENLLLHHLRHFL